MTFIIRCGAVLLIFAYTLSIGVASICIGAVDKADITTFPINLQVWLITFGIIRLTTPFGLLTTIKKSKENDTTDQTLTVLNTSFLFAIIWVIWGTILIVKYEWTSPRMYDLALTIVIIEWILFVLIIGVISIIITIRICSRITPNMPTIRIRISTTTDMPATSVTDTSAATDTSVAPVTDTPAVPASVSAV